MKLLTAMISSGKVTATYLDDAGETQCKELAVTAAAGTLAALVTTSLGSDLRSVQISTEHAEEGSGATRIEAMKADGTGPFVMMGEGDMQAANAALRVEVEAAL